MKVLASEHDVLKPEINSEATIKHIYNLTPKNIKDDFVEMKIGTEGTMEERFQNIIKVIQKHKEDNICRITLEDKPNETKPSLRTANSVVDHSNGKHNCEKNLQCKSEWGIFGCVELYKIKKIAERFSLIINKKLCF